MPLLTRLSSREFQDRMARLEEAIEAAGLSDQPAQVDSAPAPSFRRQRRLSLDQLEGLKQDYRNGASMNDIARSLGVDRSVVSRALDRMQEPKRQPGLQDGELDEVIRLYGEGWSLARLGRKFHVHDKTIAAGLRGAGITVRGRGRPTAS